jgi:hypothetical protein
MKVRLTVPNEIHAVLCTAEKDIDAVFGTQEADLAALIAPHEGNNNDLCLLALKIVHGSKADRIRQRLLLQLLVLRWLGYLGQVGCPWIVISILEVRQGLQVPLAHRDLEFFTQRHP